MTTNPHRCNGKAFHILVDNIGVVFTFKKRRSNDRLCHTIIRVSYLVAGALVCRLFASWTPRRRPLFLSFLVYLPFYIVC